MSIEQDWKRWKKDDIELLRFLVERLNLAAWVIARILTPHTIAGVRRKIVKLHLRRPINPWTGKVLQPVGHRTRGDLEAALVMAGRDHPVDRWRQDQDQLARRAQLQREFFDKQMAEQNARLGR